MAPSLVRKPLKRTVRDTDFSPNAWSCLAQSVEREALNLAVVGSNPTVLLSYSESSCKFLLVCFLFFTLP